MAIEDQRPDAFAFGGRRSLDLTWTLRYRAVAPTELLVSPQDLARWLTAAGFSPAGLPDAADLEAARSLRECIYRVAVAVVDGTAIAPADRRDLNEWARRPLPFRQLRSDGSVVVDTPPDEWVVRSLASLADDALALVAKRDGRLRRCEGPGCSLLFHDVSRPGRRRWCSTERCGNRVNTAAYRARSRTP